MRLDNRRGVAMVFVLFFVMSLAVLEVAFVASAIQGSRSSRAERDRLQTSSAAQGAVHIGVNMVNTLINSYLQDTIMNSDPSGVISYAKSKVNANDGLAWLVYCVRSANVAVLSQNGEQATYAASGTLGAAAYSYVITFMEKEDPVSSGSDAWDFPFSYRIDAVGTMGAKESKASLYGDFTVQVQRDNFAKFSLFTNQQQMSGTNIWFTDRSIFYGPVHTNDRFNFAMNPGGHFYEMATQVQSSARFYNNGSSILLNAALNGTRDVPTFDAGFARGEDSLTMNAATEESDMKSQARGSGSFSSNGIYVPTTGGNVSRGIYVKGNATVTMSVNGADKAVYTIVQGSSTRVITVDPVGNTTAIFNPSNNTTSTYNGVPDGNDDAGTIIFVDGDITALSGTVQRNTQLTIASHNDINITNHILYSDYTAGSGTPGDVAYVPPTASGAANLLGLVSWNGDVVIDNTAPDNINIHGTVMAENGVFTVESYNNYDVRGTATLLGGAITNEYGAFGLFNSSSGQTVSGYGRNFIYDERMQQGEAPPYFPTLDTFIAFTNDIVDKVVWLETK